MTPPNGTADRKARAASTATFAVVLAVAGAAIVSGGGPRPVRDAPDTMQGQRLPQRTVREAPVFRGIEVVPEARPGRLSGELWLTGRECHAVTLALGTLLPTMAREAGCPESASPSGRVVVERAGTQLTVRDVAGGRVLSRSPTAAGQDARLAAAVDDDGSLATCEGDDVVVRAPGRATRTVPGCEPVALRSGLHWLADPDVDGLPLTDAEGRRVPLTAPALRQTGGPYLLAASPGGDYLAALAFHPSLGRHVLVVRVRDGHIVGRRSIDAQLRADDVRVAPDGQAVAVRVTTRDDPAPLWHLWRLDRRTPPVPSVGGERVTDVAFSPDGRHLAVVTRRRSEVVILAAETFGPVARIPADSVGPTPRAVMWLP